MSHTQYLFYHTRQAMGTSPPSINRTEAKKEAKGKQLEKPSYESDSDEEIQDQVFTGDILQKITQERITKNLHRHIGFLIFKVKQPPPSMMDGYGTGLLISPNLILTCSHNILNKKTRQENYDFRFFPGHCGELNVDGGYKVEKVFYPQQYKEQYKSVSHKYALLKLVKKIPSQSFIPLHPITQDNFRKKIAVFGYLGKRYAQSFDDSGKKLSTFQWGKKKDGILEIQVKRGRIEHSITTYEGQSGAPIITVDHNDLSVIGIHEGGSQNYQGKGPVNLGRLITYSVIQEMKNKALQWGAQMFNIYAPGARVNCPRIFSGKLRWLRELQQFQDTLGRQNKVVYQVPASEMKELPHRLIGMVSFGKAGRGSGILLSPNLVLTAGYNAYDRDNKKQWNFLRFSPGFSSATPQLQYQVQNSYVHANFFQKQSIQFDCCLLKLTQKIETKEFIPIKVDPTFEEHNQQIAIFGYNDPNKSEHICSIGSFGKRCGVKLQNSNKEFYYELQTLNGMGGGPILSVDESGEIAIVGIHKGGANQKLTDGRSIGCKSGRVMTSWLVEELRRVAENMGADPFLIARN